MLKIRKNNFMVFLLCFVMLFTTVIMPQTAVAADTGSQTLAITDMDGRELSELEVLQDDKTTLKAAGTNAEALQWQLYAEEYDMWISIHGETQPECILSYAKIGNMLNSENETRIRVVEGERISEEVLVRVVEPAETGEPAAYAARAAAADVEEAEEASTDKYTVVINYLYQDGTTAASSYAATLAAGTDFSAAVDNPAVVGYKASADTENLPEGIMFTEAAVTLNITGISENMTINIVYQPDLVNYTVIHYQQNISNDNYTEVARETRQGLTDSQVPDVTNSYDGFFALIYEKPTIAADGSTIVEVYYDRNYYLMYFDLDGGYGVEPIYARYGTEIGDIAAPQKTGYAFQNWTLEKDSDAQVNIAETMPAENVTYYAVWTANFTTFTVVYWLENPENEEYSYWGSREIANHIADDSAVLSGDVVNGEDYKDYSEIADTLDTYEKQYSSYSHADSNVTVKGDGSSVVNVYYDRNDYTLKFYYAMEDASSYYVIGGSTYRFGASATISDTGNEVSLLDHYMGDYSSQRGSVDELPTLNEIGEARDYTHGSDTSTVNGTEYKYHYISFTAKYGADISALWPCNVFDSVTRTSGNSNNSWSGTEAFVSAWNGEHHVYYSQNNGNQTIKGNYNELDYQLLWKNSTYGDSSTVAYLCFWENGADISWSIPELYRYNIYVPVLDGQDTTGLTLKTYQGITYYLRNVYDTCDNSTVGEQTMPPIQGLTYIGYNYEEITDYDTSLYQEAYDVNFYYSRDTYNLTFHNVNLEDRQEVVAYEADISDFDYEPVYPDENLRDNYVFRGWYTTPEFFEGTQFSFEDMTMPAKHITLYAKWELVKRYVELYPSKEDMTAGTNQIGETIETIHGNTVAEVPETPENGDYTFVGWFYMDGTQEKAFDFANMPVNSDMKVYAKWSSNVLKQYFVYYKYVDSDGTEIEIAEPTTGSALAGNTKTFEAKGGTDLYEGYREGYFPLPKTHSMVVDIAEDGSNQYTFYYVQKDAVPYKVMYLDAATGEPLLSEKVVADNRQAVVTENCVPISGYMPDAYQKRMVVNAEDGAVNEIIFYYTEDTQHAYYKISYYTENLNGGWTEYTSSEAIGDIGKEYSASALDINGFTYSGGAEGTLTAGTLTADGLHLKLYYTRNEYPYEIRYLEAGTGKVLADPTQGKALYGETVSANAKTEQDEELLQYYTLTSSNPQTLAVKIEESQETAQLNILNFYYKENEYNVNYVVAECSGTVELIGAGAAAQSVTESVKILTGDPNGAIARPAENYEFRGWYLTPDCSGAAVSMSPAFDPKGLGQEITYYAKFAEQNAQIQYEVAGAVDGGLVALTGSDQSDKAVSETVDVISGSAAGASAAVTNSDYYTFEGWYDEEGTLLTEEADFVPGKEAGTPELYKSATYYARFAEKKVEITYTVASGFGSVSIDGSSIETERDQQTVTEQVSILSGPACGATAVGDTAYGYEFEGWYLNPDCTVPTDFEGNYIYPEKTDGRYEPITYYAKFTQTLSQLTIEKQGVQPEDQEESFTFTVTGPEDMVMTVTVKGNDSVVLKNLPHGDYTITENDGWAWRYDLADIQIADGGEGSIDVNNKSVTLSLGHEDDRHVIFTNSKEEDSWMDCSIRMNNLFTVTEIRQNPDER